MSAVPIPNFSMTRRYLGRLLQEAALLLPRPRRFVGVDGVSLWEGVGGWVRAGVCRMYECVVNGGRGECMDACMCVSALDGGGWV